METSALVEQIKAAFPLLPLPKMSLHQSQLADQGMAREISEAEWAAAGALDAGRTWDSFTDEELAACDAALSHLDGTGFAYYLPAYLLLALRHFAVEWDHPAWAITGSTVFVVTHRSDYNLARFAQLSVEQVAAVKAFLEAAAASPTDNAQDARIALQRYWYTDRAGRPPLGA